MILRVKLKVGDKSKIREVEIDDKKITDKILSNFLKVEEDVNLVSLSDMLIDKIRNIKILKESCIMKFDFDKLEVGDEVYHIVLGWVKVDKLLHNQFGYFVGEKSPFGRDGMIDRVKHRKPVIVAIRKKD